MRTKLALAGLLAGAFATFMPAASASCIQVDVIDRCINPCPGVVTRPPVNGNCTQ